MLLLLGVVAVMVWILLREPVAARCARVELENAQAVARPVNAPPKPSDVAWYEEHCFQGKPR